MCEFSFTNHAQPKIKVICTLCGIVYFFTSFDCFHGEGGRERRGVYIYVQPYLYNIITFYIKHEFTTKLKHFRYSLSVYVKHLKL